ncbi:MAG: sigma-54 interaction domain-containing protein, partial [Bdellovibrionota bacterium]
WPTQLKYDPASQSMAELDRKITKLAGTPLSVLLLGETGTGKDVVAREIHGRSARAAKPLVAVNCAAIPATLLESTLFGYEKGAFTGAERAQPGKFMQAQGGTLFLDEIGDLPLELQAKLLRVLQDRKVEPLGAREAVAVDIRILAATHQNLEEAVRSGRFRQDLYFRLNGATIKIPPLRERRGDILPLAQHFLARAGAELKLSCDAIEALQMHPWPGNVRELEQVITRAGLLAEGTEIQVSDLELQKENPGATDYSLGSFATLEEAQLAFTRDFVERALERSGGNRAETAQSLGVSERTLYRILRSDSVVSGD